MMKECGHNNLGGELSLIPTLKLLITLLWLNDKPQVWVLQMPRVSK